MGKKPVELRGRVFWNAPLGLRRNEVTTECVFSEDKERCLIGKWQCNVVQRSWNITRKAIMRSQPSTLFTVRAVRLWNMS